MEIPLYLVGGALRDVLLTGRTLDLDIDLVAIGDALKLGESVAHELAADFQAHRRFLTADIRVGDTHIDLVTARREEYDEPASLPRVTPSDLQDDLARRDFTVNAMALPLWPPGDGTLVDPWQGQADLGKRWLRVLHDRSFFDDPTRILRGVRIGARQDLEFEPRTAELAVAAIEAGAFDALSGSRLRHEMALLLEEPQVEASLRRLAQMEFFAVLGLTPSRDKSDWQTLQAILELRSRDPESELGDLEPRWWFAILMALCAHEDQVTREELAKRLDVDGELLRILRRFPERIEDAVDALEEPDVPQHKVCETLQELASEELVLLTARGDSTVRTWVQEWLEGLRDIRLEIGGDDLHASGFGQSPDLGRALKATLKARQDGRIGPADELDFAVRYLREGGRSTDG